MSQNITAADVVAKVRELAAETPDYVYPLTGGQCANVVRDDAGEWVGSCIVGQAVVAEGVPAALLAMRARFATVGALFEVLEIPNRRDETEWLREVQILQDDGRPWGAAVAFADKAAAVTE